VGSHAFLLEKMTARSPREKGKRTGSNNITRKGGEVQPRKSAPNLKLNDPRVSADSKSQKKKSGGNRRSLLQKKKEIPPGFRT